ncbi:MAG: hypothetical protein ACXQT3_05520 [Methermicoccaceae archaeon]
MHQFFSRVALCPRCGKWGKLTIERKGGDGEMARYRIVHPPNGCHRQKECHVSWTSEGWDELDAIFGECRVVERELRAEIERWARGLQWDVVRRGKRVSIRAQCPVCGMWGNVQRYKTHRLKKTGLQMVHRRGGHEKRCAVPPEHPAFSHLWQVYCGVRGCEDARKVPAREVVVA